MATPPPKRLAGFGRKTVICYTTVTVRRYLFGFLQIPLKRCPGAWTHWGISYSGWLSVGDL